MHPSDLQSPYVQLNRCYNHNGSNDYLKILLSAPSSDSQTVLLRFGRTPNQSPHPGDGVLCDDPCYGMWLLHTRNRASHDTFTPA